MGIIQDISDVMRKGPEIASQMNAVKLNTKSIVRGAKDSTFQFPFLIADSAPIDMANTAVRLFDRVYASFTQTWLSVNSMFDITIDPTPLSYLKRLHQNMKLEGVDELEVDENETSDYMEKVYDGNYRLYMNPEKNYGVLINMKNEGLHQMYESHKVQLTDFMSGIDLVPFEAMEADNAADLANAMIAGQTAKRDDERRELMLRQTDRSKAPQLLDRDVKKSNDMMPYGIQVRLIALNDKKEFVQYVDFIVGVKTIMHPISSDDMIENIARGLQNKSLSFKLLKWTSGEISLMKDIIFNVNDIKSDAVNRANGKSPFFGTLKRLRGKKIGMSNLTVPHALIPNATIAITSYEVDYLKNNYAIDVRNEKIANKLISSLFLMAFVILDEGTNTLSVLYDGDNAFQTYSMETLERENSLTSNKLGREIGRMISH